MGDSRLVYRSIRYGIQIYLCCLGIFALYGGLWVIHVAGYLPTHSVGVVWIAMAAMARLFLLILLPIFFSSQGNLI